MCMRMRICIYIKAKFRVLLRSTNLPHTFLHKRVRNPLHHLPSPLHILHTRPRRAHDEPHTKHAIQTRLRQEQIGPLREARVELAVERVERVGWGVWESWRFQAEDG